MDGTTLIENIVKSMKCNFCNGLLSFSPIFINCQDGSKNKCGRCTSIKSGEWVRNWIFESVAQCLVFPCLYCREILPWAQVEQHESNCKHKTIQCPFRYSGCRKEIKISDMENHIAINHPRKLFQDKVSYKIDLIKNSTPLLLVVDDRQFIVYILKDSIFVGSLGPIEKYSLFNTEFTSEDGNTSVSYKNQSIVEFNERYHCYECMKERCKADHHPFSQKYKKPSVYPGTNPFKFFSKLDLLNSPTQVQITISVVSNQGDTTNQGNVISFSVFRTSIREHIKCPICREYLIGPIFSCKIGHGICRKCKSRINQCPSCESECDGSRCFQLEHLVENVNISCPNKEKGCSVVGNIQRISGHKIECNFRCISLESILPEK